MNILSVHATETAHTRFKFYVQFAECLEGEKYPLCTECWKHEDKYPFIYLLDMLPSFAERRIKLLCPFQITFLFFLFLLGPLCLTVCDECEEACFSFTIKSITVVNFNAFRKFSSDWGIFIVNYEEENEKKKARSTGFVCNIFMIRLCLLWAYWRCLRGFNEEIIELFDEFFKLRWIYWLFEIMSWVFAVESVWVHHSFIKTFKTDFWNILDIQSQNL